MMSYRGSDFYRYYKAEPHFFIKLKAFVKKRGIELTIAVVGLIIGFATVMVSYQIGIHQEILQASRITDSYFNGIVDLFVKSADENQKINLLMIARTEAIISDLDKLKKPDKLASVITFISNLKPQLFYKEMEAQIPREKYIYLGEINLANTSLPGLDLEKASLPFSNLSGCDLSHTILKSAFLKKTNFENANLNYTNFNGSNLQNANLKNATIYQASFDNANLENAIWINGIRCKKGSIGQCIY